jgi:lipoate-protein ligase A
VFYLELFHTDIPKALAVDEVLLADFEARSSGDELLYVWEPSGFGVIVGSGTRLEREVKMELCRALKVPVFRRISGGSAVVIGPGCLMYSLFLNRRKWSGFNSPAETHRFVLTQIADGLKGQLPSIEFRDPSDLAYCGRKFSGNSIRIRRDYLLYHGTLLYRFPLEVVSLLLEEPPRQPVWRNKRSHKEFLTNIPLAREELATLLRDVWQACSSWTHLDWRAISQLARDKYSRASWNERL